MKRKKFFEMLTYKDAQDAHELGMILSNNCDMGSHQGALISVKQFPKLIDDIKLWRKNKNLICVEEVKYVDNTDNPFCKLCQESDCLISDDEDEGCEMVRIYKRNKDFFERCNKVCDEMITLAAEMATVTNMPSEFIEDWKLPKTIPEKVKKKIIKVSEKASRQSRDWANGVRNLEDYLRKGR